jgi:hypothetical protein
MNNLVIGNTSQLSLFFPDTFVKISSRNINYDNLKKEKWDKIFLCFGESRKFLKDTNLYDEVNFLLTLNTIENLYDYCNEIIIYSTCELWNKYSGQISIDLDFDFFPTPYLNSKFKITNHILSSPNYGKVKIMYPFNFNSVLRDISFLFGKIFHSIKNKTSVEIGDTFFYRDIVHPKFVVNESINSNGHKIIGSGRLTFVNDFIIDLYDYFQLDHQKLIIYKKDIFQEYIKREEYYLRSEKCNYSYNELLKDTINDINMIKK